MKPSSLEHLTEMVADMVGIWQAQAAVNIRASEVFTEIQAELAEIRDSIIDLDHGKASSAHLRELHSRVDELTSVWQPRGVA